MTFAEEKAVVSYTEGEFAFLETHNNPSCDNCSSKSGCGQVSSIFTFKPKNKLKVNNTFNLKAGDEVIVAMPYDKLLKATFLMYVLPLLLLFMFALIAKLALGEPASMIAGILGLLTGLLLVNKYSQQKIIADQYRPKLIRKIINLEPV